MWCGGLCGRIFGRVRRLKNSSSCPESAGAVEEVAFLRGLGSEGRGIAESGFLIEPETLANQREVALPLEEGGVLSVPRIEDVEELSFDAEGGLLDALFVVFKAGA